MIPTVLLEKIPTVLTRHRSICMEKAFFASLWALDCVGKWFWRRYNHIAIIVQFVFSKQHGGRRRSNNNVTMKKLLPLRLDPEFSMSEYLSCDFVRYSWGVRSEEQNKIWYIDKTNSSTFHLQSFNTKVWCSWCFYWRWDWNHGARLVIVASGVLVTEALSPLASPSTWLLRQKRKPKMSGGWNTSLYILLSFPLLLS